MLDCSIEGRDIEERATSRRVEIAEKTCYSNLVGRYLRKRVTSRRVLEIFEKIVTSRRVEISEKSPGYSKEGKDS